MKKTLVLEFEEGENERLEIFSKAELFEIAVDEMFQKLRHHIEETALIDSEIKLIKKIRSEFIQIFQDKGLPLS